MAFGLKALKRVVKGRKITDKADAAAADLKGAQSMGAKMIKSNLAELQDTKGAVQSKISRGAKLAAQQAKDAQMRSKTRAAQSGLQGTSIGQAMQQQATEQAAKGIQDIRGQKTDLTRQFAKEGMAAGSQGVAAGGPVKMKTTSYYKGGMGKALGALAGGMMGGPMGAQMGASLGGALQGS